MEGEGGLDALELREGDAEGERDAESLALAAAVNVSGELAETPVLGVTRCVPSME